MESRQRIASKRNSGIYEYNFEEHGKPVHRRTSKKTSSKDRHGQVYSDDFAENSVRAVTPEPTLPAPTEHPMERLRSPSGTVLSQPEARKTSVLSSDHPAAFYDFSNKPAVSAVNEPIVRPRTRTLEDIPRDRSPKARILRSRNRIGSLQAHVPPPLQNIDDSISSIGFPSIIPSPPLSSHGQPPPTSHGLPSRQRLVKQPPRPLSPLAIVSNHSSAQPSPTTNASKVLQLMKTTCGRMHGILSFRASSTGAWNSGYCAINVASGSLIYQMKGDVSQARTLIPDLRGCQVRTSYDKESQMNFLDVSTRTSGLGIHLRPHVPETFDSWLAALLCWQPIRSKGVQNKMTKPQATILPERRLGDRKRNSEVNLHRDAAIIKVGKMRIWDKDLRFSSSTTVTNRRMSTYNKLGSPAKSWHRVSCTLQENGHLKLYTENDVSLISIIPLSQLSRCAVQRLDPSVVDDDFCLAIYPQYTAARSSPSSLHTVYLSLESRVLFEVWYVLLRAFTIPELYGPEIPALRQDLGSPGLEVHEQQVSASDLFRIERVLSLRLVEAKVHAPTLPPAPGAGTSPKMGTSHRHDWTPGNYYAEVNFDGEIRAKTAVKSETSNPFWREDYDFMDLPPVLSSTSIILKTTSPGQTDWTLVGSAPYVLDNGDMKPSDIVGDLEISSFDATHGIVDYKLDDLDRGVDSEKWWPILNESDEVVGDMLIKIRADELVVLMSHDYQPLSELLHSFSNGLTQQIVSIAPTELKRLSETFLNIFQVSAQSSNWLMSLVEDEIDGVHKENQISRFRYSRRIASNDSYDSGLEREVVLRDLGKSATVEANLLFRGNSLLTKALDLHMRRLGKEYLEDTLSEKMRDIDESNPDCEVDPNRVRRPDDLQRNWRNLIALTEIVWKSIASSASRCPPELRLILRHIRSCAEDRYGDFLRTVSYSSVSGFLFLRFFCPAVLNPKLFGLLKGHPRQRAQRTLTLIAKSLQTLANLTTFGNKEHWMEPMNAFLTSHRQEFRSFVDTVCSISPDRGITPVPPSYATPITVLSRLPMTSREGFPSLPYLIDQAREFASLVEIWLDARDVSQVEEMSGDVKKFNYICEGLRTRTTDFLNRAEQAERPSGMLEAKWEELIENLGRKARIKDEQDRKQPDTPLSPHWPTGGIVGRPRTATEGSRTETNSTTSLNDVGYFTDASGSRVNTHNYSRYNNVNSDNHRPSTTVISSASNVGQSTHQPTQHIPNAIAASFEEPISPSSSLGPWDRESHSKANNHPSRSLGYMPPGNEFEAEQYVATDRAGSLGSSLYSLEANAGSVTSSAPRSPVGRPGTGGGGLDGGGKLRLGDLMGSGAFRWKGDRGK